MLRLIHNHLIIPCGDTGSFTVPLTYNLNTNAVALFCIINPSTRVPILTKSINLNTSDETITVEIAHEDTSNLMAGEYFWDITLYINPQYDEEENLIGGEEVHSYYSAFNLPICEIKLSANGVFKGN